MVAVVSMSGVLARTLHVAIGLEASAGDVLSANWKPENSSGAAGFQR